MKAIIRSVYLLVQHPRDLQVNLWDYTGIMIPQMVRLPTLLLGICCTKAFSLTAL